MHNDESGNTEHVADCRVEREHNIDNRRSEPIVASCAQELNVVQAQLETVAPIAQIAHILKPNCGSNNINSALGKEIGVNLLGFAKLFVDVSSLHVKQCGDKHQKSNTEVEHDSFSELSKDFALFDLFKRKIIKSTRFDNVKVLNLRGINGETSKRCA